ncbi:MerR family transcriptional regulator [Roseibaca sp. V10]|uniref:MerR family transcriptional regulator n=1 Tax=Roseinatronobacter domitianus TaxID=2940293 RepID=A0ABT0LXD9_9RHOB|nr:MerR family transcriptional regulator [Roseibaca domitiana]MCL1627262.1 MerR family transcriptional regulator [Roseibaca domitiana]
MRKAPEAFRTISEAAEALDTPAHVLRFWESKFSHVKPVKRAGGRRYYRPADIDLLSGIKLLLHDQGMTIRGVQKLLQEKGARHVTGLAPVVNDVLDGDVLDAVAAKEESAPSAPAMAPVADSDMPAADSSANAPKETPLPSTDPEEVPTPALPPEEHQPRLQDDTPQSGEAEPEHEPEVAPETAAPDNTAPAMTAVPEPAKPTEPPALAALLDAASAPQEPPRFARIAHALRINPPRDASRFAPALARLEQLVQTITDRAE